MEGLEPPAKDFVRRDVGRNQLRASPVISHTPAGLIFFKHPGEEEDDDDDDGVSPSGASHQNPTLIQRDGKNKK